jgi:hypothetical protein
MDHHAGTPRHTGWLDESFHRPFRELLLQRRHARGIVLPRLPRRRRAILRLSPGRCHAVIHSKRPQLTVEQVQHILQKSKK